MEETQTDFSQDGHEDHEADKTDPAREKYDAAIDAIASGTEKLTKAGLGGKDAGDIACRIWCDQNGTGHRE